MFPVTIFLLSLLSVLHTGVTSQLIDVERIALRNFMSKLRHLPRVNWSDSEPACSWIGVTCNPSNQTVLYLQLPAMSLTGEIAPYTIGTLTNLRVLSLRYNQLTGPIPTDFADLTSLSRLFLDNNLFSGQLPYISSQFLTSFNVSHNKLNTSIPSSLSKFPESAFSKNVFVCGYPLLSCDNSYLPPDLFTRSEVQEDAKNQKREIVGVSMGSTVLLLILFCSLGKNLYQRIKQRSSTADHSKMESNKLVLFDGDFDSEDLLSESKEILGEGSFGVSYKQVLAGKKTMTTLVVKRLKDVAVTENEFREKMEVLGRMKNKNLVPLKGFYNYSKDEKWLVYDYMPAGSLSAHLHGSLRTELNWDHRMKIALSAAKGLAYLHVVGEVVHGNIKSSNIFLQQETNNEALLSDYGLNTLFHMSSTMNHQVIGYHAPEVLETQKVTFESDVYSFGILLLELLTGKTPNQALLGKEGAHISKWIGSIVCDGLKEEIFDEELMNDHNADEMVQSLRIVKECVSIVPNQRPPMRNVVNMMEDMLFRKTSDCHPKEYHDRPSTETSDTP